MVGESTQNWRIANPGDQNANFGKATTVMSGSLHSSSESCPPYTIFQKPYLRPCFALRPAKNAT
jgi:hypothetical protein